MTDILLAKSLATQLEPLIKRAQSIQQKATCLELGVHFINATLQRFRLDEELLEDLNYELNKHCSNIDRERVSFLWERFVPLFNRILVRLNELKIS